MVESSVNGWTSVLRWFNHVGRIENSKLMKIVHKSEGFG